MLKDNYWKKWLYAIAGIVIAVTITITLVQHKTLTNKNSTIQVVAAENFWGSIVTQIGGAHVQVKSIVSDPNADPHEYSSNAATARSFATADFVILNGAGYDTWGTKLLSASSNSNRRVMTVAELVGKKEGDNPHFWYNPDYVNKVAAQIENDLIALDPNDKSYFQQQYASVRTALGTYQDRIATIKKQFAGTKIAATEDIFQYLSDAAGLNLISPQEFIKAVAEGNDPPADSVVQFQQQLQNGQIKMLAYNQQTVTPLTDSIKKLAADNNIPIVGVTETIQPPDTTFQEWMNAELISIQNALNASALGQ